jgi:LuxR family maltose regulon positive regulatory protein
MGLDLSAEDTAELETRTEGWIAGLQLAALSLQGHRAPTSFIQSFTGSHHFIMDYLVEEVLHQQSEAVQMFLLDTSILDRLCGPLCDAVLLDSTASGQATLNISNMPTCSSCPWTTSGAGTAITICLPIC